jgi:hypothetical protein
MHDAYNDGLHYLLTLKPADMKNFSARLPVTAFSLLFFLASMGPALHARPDGCGESGDNVILIHTTDSFEQAYKTIGELFISNGYLVEHSDPSLGVLTTDSRQVGYSALVWSVRSSAFIKGTENVTIMLTAKWQNDPGHPWNVAVNTGTGRGLNRLAWAEICKIADQYPGAEVVSGQ